MKPIPKAVLSTAPAALAVDLTALKSFMRIDGSGEDTLLTILAKSATERIEEYIAQKLITQTWNIFYDSFGYKPSDQWHDGVKDGIISDYAGGAPSFLDLPFGPLVSVTAFKTYADDDTASTFAASNYTLDTKGPFGRVALRMGAVWPTTVLRPVNGIEINGAVFGYGASNTSVPSAIQHAIMLTVSKVYENRGDSASGEFFGVGGFTIPNTAQMLLAPYVRHRV